MSTIRGLAIALCAATPVGVAFAQQARGTTADGVVRDASSRAPLADVEIRLAGQDTVVARTDARGAWRAESLRPGRYTVLARRLGYAAESRQLVLTNDAAHLELSLDAAPYALDQMVVTADRRLQKLADAVTTTELVTREDIERTGASDISTILIEQTGIQLEGGHPAGTGVMLQGIDSKHVLILLDGQPVAGRISGVFDVSRIPTAMVERIEVVKGPQSTLYGTDAMGGVVNIVTRTPARGAVDANITLTGGSQDRREGSGSVSLGRGDFTARFDGGRRTIETTPGMSEANVGSLAARTDGMARLRWQPAVGACRERCEGSASFAEASVLLLDERQRWLSNGFYNFGDNQQVNGRITGALQRGNHRITPTLFASLYDHRLRSSQQSLPLAGDDGSRQRQRIFQGELLYNGRFGATGAHGIDAGALFRRDEALTERVEGGIRSLDVVEPFVQADIAATSRLSIVPGLRVTRSAQWGTHVTPRVASRLRATDGLTLRASVGEGYRAPDFKELFMRFVNVGTGYSYAVNGNPNLGPESSRNVTVGADWVGNRTFLRGQFFHNGFTDFIEANLVSSPDAPQMVFEYQNLENGWTRGVDLETGFAFNGWRVEGGYSALATRNEATGRELLGRPAQSGRLLVARTLPLAIRASVSGTFTGRTPMQRDEETGATSLWRDAFTRFDARVARDVPRGMEFVAGVDNLFDTLPAQWAGFTGRHVYVALSWTLSRTTAP